MLNSTLQSLLGDQLQIHQPLAKYTAARLGGYADMLYVARLNTVPMQKILETAWSAEIPITVLGGGANVLISDAGIRGLTIVNHISEVSFLENAKVHVTSGTSLSTLARKCQSAGLAGMEWAISVPGTVGGAIVNNAGAHGGDISDSLVQCEVFSFQEPVCRWTNADLLYEYRVSALKHRTDKRFFVLDAVFQFTEEHPDEIQTKMREFSDYRKRTQPPGASLGSIFKNPPNDYAGRLIEDCGLKGMSIGGVSVSPVHANFFVNGGDSTATDYRALIETVQARVYAQTAIQLEPEVQFLGEWC